MGRFPRLRSFPTDGNLNVGYCLVAMEATDNSNDKRLTVPVEAAPDSVADKLNRLAYAGAESIGNEVTSRVQKSIDNPAELVVSGGQSYVAGTLLGALGKMPGPFKYLAGITGASLAAFSMKDELSQENLAKIGGTTQSIWDSKEDMDSKVLSMQKSFAPLVLDAGSLVLGVLTGKGLQKKKHNDNEHQSDFQWRMDGYETKRLKFNEFIYLLTTGQKCTTTRTEHKGSQFYWPWSGKAEEHKLYKKLEDAKTFWSW